MFCRHNGHRHQGLISPNFVCQAKRRQRTAFGKKFAVQFHQLNNSTINTKLKPKIVRHSPNLCAVRQTLCAKKSFSSVRAKYFGKNVDEIDPWKKKSGWKITRKVQVITNLQQKGKARKTTIIVSKRILIEIFFRANTVFCLLHCKVTVLTLVEAWEDYNNGQLRLKEGKGFLIGKQH